MTQLKDGSQMDVLNMRPSIHPRLWHYRRLNLILLVCLLLVYAGTHVVVVNGQPSVPVGLWWIQPVSGVIMRGMVVLYPPPVATRAYAGGVQRFLKPVAAVAGDMVCVEEGQLWIRGESYGPVVETVGGQVIPHLVGCRRIEAGEVFVASHQPRSHDSRYYGPVAVERITHTATPLWTWGE